MQQLSVNEAVDKMFLKIQELLDEKKKNNSNNRVLIAVDGRCTSGKSTLAGELSKKLDCNVFHMDDFFLRPEQRQVERYMVAGENVDHERFLEEVMEKLVKGEPVEYRRFDCESLKLGEANIYQPKDINIVEGTYSCHKSLVDNYDLIVFMDVEEEVQLQRIKERNGEAMLEMFRTLWIPLEEAYFAKFRIDEKCHIYIK